MDTRLRVWGVALMLVALTSCKGKKQEAYVEELKADLPPSCSYFPSETNLMVDCEDEAGLDKLKSRFKADCDKIKDAGWAGIVINISGGEKMYSAGGLDPLDSCNVK